MITCNLKALWRRKDEQDGVKRSFRTLEKETGLSLATLQRLTNPKKPIERIETPTIDALCRYFKCGLGELFAYQENTAVENN